jgi:hypothetical protein
MPIQQLLAVTTLIASLAPDTTIHLLHSHNPLLHHPITLLLHSSLLNYHTAPSCCYFLIKPNSISCCTSPLLAPSLSQPPLHNSQPTFGTSSHCTHCLHLAEITILLQWPLFYFAENKYAVVWWISFC